MQKKRENYSVLKIYIHIYELMSHENGQQGKQSKMETSNIQQT